MIVDFHTHLVSTGKFTEIRNLSFSEAETIFASNENGLFSVGFHPWMANEFSAESFDLLEKWVKDERLVLLGECGLDKNSKIPINHQLAVFERQILLSELQKKPLLIHCVGCFNELFSLKKIMNPSQQWIIHGFRGKAQLAVQAMNAGCALSFGEHFNIESVRCTPLDKLFVETDESALSIEEIYRKIAVAKGCQVADLSAGAEFVGRLVKRKV